MSSPERVADESVSGEAGRPGRRWLAAVAILAFSAFAADTVAVTHLRLLPFDLPVAELVQRLPRGPLT